MDPLILTNTTWNTDFVLSNSVTVFPGVTLTIINATIDFENSASIDLQTDAKVILQDAEFMGPSGRGIQFLNEDPAFVIADNFTCSNMDVCIARQCCDGNEVEISNSIFKENRLVFDGYAGRVLRATGCSFLGNEAVTSQADHEFRGCLFSNNTVAVAGERNKVYDSTFMFNGQAMQDPNGFSEYMNNVVFYSNDVALRVGCCGNDLSSFRNVTFVENEIAIQAGSARFGTDPVAASNFVDNTRHIVHTGSRSSSVTNLYWGTTDIDDIRAKIVDIFTDPSYGLVTIKPISDTPFLHGLYDGSRPWGPPESLLPTNSPTESPTTTRASSQKIVLAD